MCKKFEFFFHFNVKDCVLNYKMATFSFDYEKNITNNKLPSVKAINTNFCGEDTGGLWIAMENLDKVKWKKECGKNCTNSCTEHYINTAQHNIKTNSKDANGKRITVEGKGILNPRIIIVRRSRLLKFNYTNNQYEGLWVKNDGLIMENNSKKYYCQMKYAIVFVDENNYPLHDDYIQLSTKGTFMVDFDKNYLEFRKLFLISYEISTKKPLGGKAIEQWYSMSVFVPTFGSRSVKSSIKGQGGDSVQCDACYVESFEKPTEFNWQTMCIGRTLNVNEQITHIYNQTEDWYKRYTTNPTSEKSQNQSPSTSNQVNNNIDTDDENDEDNICNKMEKICNVSKPSYRVKQGKKQ